MITIHLPNTNGDPIKVVGATSLYVGETETADGKRRLRLCLYRNHEGRLSYTVSYSSSWRFEIEHHQSGHAADMHDLLHKLRAISPGEWVVGFPVDKQPDLMTKHKALLREVFNRWNALITSAVGHVNAVNV